MAHDDRHQQTATDIERVDRDLLLPADPEDVWTVITGDGWLAERVELELAPGGEARFTDPGSVRTGWIEEVQPPTTDDEGRLVYWWGAENEPATRVELTLWPEGDGTTRLRVIESRPLEALELIGVPLPGQGGISQGGMSRGPAMLAAA
jgi:uncharacterized protein YndB with AHSA1/START domain